MHFDDYPSESKSSDFLCILVNVLFLLYFLIEVTIFVLKICYQCGGISSFYFCNDITYSVEKSLFRDLRLKCILKTF